MIIYKTKDQKTNMKNETLPSEDQRRHVYDNPWSELGEDERYNEIQVAHEMALSIDPHDKSGNSIEGKSTSAYEDLKDAKAEYEAAVKKAEYFKTRQKESISNPQLAQDYNDATEMAYEVSGHRAIAMDDIEQDYNAVAEKARIKEIKTLKRMGRVSSAAYITRGENKIKLIDYEERKSTTEPNEKDKGTAKRVLTDEEFARQRDLVENLNLVSGKKPTIDASVPTERRNLTAEELSRARDQVKKLNLVSASKPGMDSSVVPETKLPVIDLSDDPVEREQQIDKLFSSPWMEKSPENIAVLEQYFTKQLKRYAKQVEDLQRERRDNTLGYSGNVALFLGNFTHIPESGVNRFTYELAIKKLDRKGLDYNEFQSMKFKEVAALIGLDVNSVLENYDGKFS
jgi:hypothetical protein